MKALAHLLLDRLSRRGVDYADVRVVHRIDDQIAVRNELPEVARSGESYGFGVRVLKNGCWGFGACSDVTSRYVDEAVDRAIETAEAAALVGGQGERFVPPAAIQASYETPFDQDPFTVSFEQRLGLLVECTQAMRREKSVRHAEGFMSLRRENKLFANTLGSLIHQEIVQCGAGIAAYALGDGELQVRSYPNSAGGNFATAGYEFIEAMALKENAERVACEAAELLRAPVCPSLTADLILDSSQLALQIHESIGHAVELDRILGHEASFAGTSFVEPSMIGSFGYGSPEVNVYSDSTCPLGLGTFGYDDEGVRAQRDAIIDQGRLVGVLSSCSTAPGIGRQPNATMRADGWGHFPLIRMTNLNLAPGTWELEDLISDTRHGFLLETNKSWSIDDRRVHFQFATELAREIRGGKLGQLYKNPVYAGTTTQFWNACDAVCNERHWRIWGLPNCGKGEPMQVAHVSHGCAPARFRRVTLGGS